jgi:hypothetical protein
MAFSGNNQTIFNAALDGMFAGALCGKPFTDGAATPNSYATLEAACVVFATAMDADIPTNANLSTGAGGTTIDPVAGVTTASLNALGHLAFGVAFAQFFQRFTADLTAGDYTVAAAACAAAFKQAVLGFAAAPGGSSLT